MRPYNRYNVPILIVVLSHVLLLFSAAQASQCTPAASLRFSVSQGNVRNEFFREGPVAAHLVLTSGPAPRLIVAFPAGNSGVALWFDGPSAAVAWQSVVTMSAAQRDLPDGTLRGITAELGVTGAPIAITHAITSSVRVIRDYEYTGETPPEVSVFPQVSKNTVVWKRRRLDGAPGYLLSIDVLSGTIAGETRPIELMPDVDGQLRLRVTALTGDTPLAPIPEDELLTAAAKPDAQLRRILAFLSYEKKLLAGSWRFNTYFGRDTLMSLQLLMPVLQPRVAEAGLAAVLDRLSAEGEVAHEEDISEYALLRRVRQGDPPSDAPIFDYKMIDDDFLLPVVAAHYLLGTPAGRARAADFLARQAASGDTYGATLVRNFRFVVSTTAAFAHDPDWRNLVSLKPGETAGNWRDSEEGLGGGRFPYDVNGVFVPAALAAISRLYESGVVRAYVDVNATAALSRAAAMADVWLHEAPPYFDVNMTPGLAVTEVERYARRVGVRSSPALAALANDPVAFRGVALDGQGRPLPILNSDEAFALLFLDIAPAEVERILDTLMRPFPAGLMTDVGLVVADPAYAADDLEPLFGRTRYHGTVIWSWQQAMLAAGISRQLSRRDLTASARDSLTRAHTRLKAALAASHDMRGSELWSWSQSDGRYSVERFGQRQEDETESNAAQLWSTVHLVPFPSRVRQPGRGADEIFAHVLSMNKERDCSKAEFR